jgi:protein-L-isoaspartate(D-aspartate) O-methyltransferase
LIDGFDALRRAMVSNQLRTVAVDDPRLIAALDHVPREVFVPADRRAVAYADLAVPLNDDRALNTPMATARLLNAAAITADDSVLIVGAATGYAAALAVVLARAVTGVESDPVLAAAAQANLPDIRIITGPMCDGAPDAGPFDVIVIDGAVEAVPAALIAQLSPSGRIATGIVENGVTRLALGHRGGSGFAVVAFADADTVVLPGFARPRAFVF